MVDGLGAQILCSNHPPYGHNINPSPAASTWHSLLSPRGTHCFLHVALMSLASILAYDTKHSSHVNLGTGEQQRRSQRLCSHQGVSRLQHDPHASAWDLNHLVYCACIRLKEACAYTMKGLPQSFYPSSHPSNPCNPRPWNPLLIPL